MGLHMSDKTAGMLAIVGGILLLLSGWRGMVDILSIFEVIIVEEVGIDDPSLILLLRVIIFFAGLGGISIILGGILILKDMVFFGRVLILLGVGMGILGFLITIIIYWLDGSLAQFHTYLFYSVEGIGLLLSILAHEGAKT